MLHKFMFNKSQPFPHSQAARLNRRRTSDQLIDGDAVYLRHPGRIIPRTELLTELGNDLSLYMDRTIDVLILRLRRKIEAVPSKPVHLQTRRGQGYIFVIGATT